MSNIDYNIIKNKEPNGLAYAKGVKSMTHTIIKIKNQSLVIEPEILASDYTITEKVILSYVRQNRVVDFTDICLFLNIDMKTAAEGCASLKLLQEDIQIGNTVKSMIFEEKTYNEVTNENINFNTETKTIETKENNKTNCNNRQKENLVDKQPIENDVENGVLSPSLDEEVVSIDYKRLDLRNIDIEKNIESMVKEPLFDNGSLQSLRDIQFEVNKGEENPQEEDYKINKTSNGVKDETMAKTKTPEHFTCDINGLRNEKTWKPVDKNYKTPPEEEEYAFWDDNDLEWAEDNKDKKIEDFVNKERAIIEELATTRGVNGQEIPIVKVEEHDDPWACSQQEQEQWDRDIASLFNTEYDDIEMQQDEIIKKSNSDLDRFNKDVVLIDNDWNRWLAKRGYYAWIEPEGYAKQCSYNKYVYYSDYITCVKDKLNFYDATMYMICQINRICDFKVGAIFDIFKPQELKELKAIGKPVSQIIDDFKVVKVNCKTKAQAIETYRYAIRIACEKGEHAKIR